MKALSFRSLRQRIRFAVPVTLFRVVRLGKLESPLRPLCANVTSGRQRRARIAVSTQPRRTATDLSHSRTREAYSLRFFTWLSTYLHWIILLWISRTV